MTRKTLIFEPILVDLTQIWVQNFFLLLQATIVRNFKEK